MIRSLNEWRENKLKLGKKLIEDYAPNNSYLYPFNLYDIQQLQKVTDAAIELQLDKDSTINAIRSLFVDPAQAPEEVNVQFVKDNLEKILNNIHEMPAEQFATPIGYTEQMLKNDSQYEQIVICENANELKDIQGLIIEGNIVYVPDTTKLSPTLNKRIIEFLKNNNTKNLANHIKWTRKILQK